MLPTPNKKTTEVSVRKEHILRYIQQIFMSLQFQYWTKEVLGVNIKKAVYTILNNFMSGISILEILALIEMLKSSVDFNLKSILSFWVFRPEDSTSEYRVILKIDIVRVWITSWIILQFSKFFHSNASWRESCKMSIKIIYITQYPKLPL